MPRKAKAAPVLKPCRCLSIGEACVLLLVRSEWEPFDDLQARAAGMPRYELKGHLGVLAILSLVELDGRRYRLRPGGRTDNAVAAALVTLRAAS